jgi:acyl-coenzyme A synthetase/AMP-(fatty) acid ligase
MDVSEISADARSGNAARLHEATARHHGEALAVEYHGETLTHGELSAESAAFAGALAEHGIDPGAEIAAEEIQECFLDRIAPYKHPREVAFVDELPRTASGKLDRARTVRGVLVFGE